MPRSYQPLRAELVLVEAGLVFAVEPAVVGLVVVVEVFQVDLGESG